MNVFHLMILLLNLPIKDNIDQLTNRPPPTTKHQGLFQFVHWKIKTFRKHRILCEMKGREGNGREGKGREGF